MHTKFEVSSFTRCKDMMRAQNIKIDHVTLTTPNWGWFVIPTLILISFACAHNLKTVKF